MKEARQPKENSAAVVQSCNFSYFFKLLRKHLADLFFEPPQSPLSHHSHRIVPRVLLDNCLSVDEHYDYIEEIALIARDKYGKEGLKAIGFHYQFVTCEHRAGQLHLSTTRENAQGLHHSVSAGECSQCQTQERCTSGTKLFHTKSNTPITMQNRKKFIADGNMYEIAVRLCQEYAHELMLEAGSMHWVSVCENPEKGNPIRILVDRDYPIPGQQCTSDIHESIHHCNSQHSDGDLVMGFGKLNRKGGSDDDEDGIRNSVGGNTVPTSARPILLITTGKGKVRAGIFSRKHLLVSSIESSTALPMIHDAKRRNMSVAVLDPNARGDRYGMATYEQSMRVLFGVSGGKHNSNTVYAGNNKDDSIGNSSKTDDGISSPLYILAHSASGAQLTRHLQSPEGNHILPRIKSIAFTDSNHSIQWLKDHNSISSFFQSPSTLYVRSSNAYRDDGNHKPGDVVSTKYDEHWKHRFGDVHTIWAGTTEHSLSNWTSREYIWRHFDKCMKHNDCESVQKGRRKIEESDIGGEEGLS